MHNYFKDRYTYLVPVYRSKGRGRKKILKYKQSVKTVIFHLSGQKGTWAEQKAAYDVS